MTLDSEDPREQITQWLTMLSDCCKGNNPVGFYYKGGPAEFLLQHGKWFEPVALPTEIYHGRMKECFYNASMAARFHNLRYVEGYAYGAVLPVHHAWCVDEDGKALEVTWKEPGTAYFGVELNPHKVIDLKHAVADAILFNHRYFEMYEKPWKEYSHGIQPRERRNSSVAHVTK